MISISDNLANEHNGEKMILNIFCVLDVNIEVPLKIEGHIRQITRSIIKNLEERSQFID